MPGVDPISLATSATQFGFGALEGVLGLSAADKAKKEAAVLAATRPKYTVNPNVQSEVSLAQSELSNGMSADAETAYNEGIDRDLSTTLDALLKSGGSPNNIAETFDNSEIGRQKLAMMKDNLRLNHVNSLVSAYRNQTDETDKAFLYNIDAPWKDAAQANAAARENANKQVFGGLNTAGSGLMNAFSTVSTNNKLNDFLKTNNSTSSNTLQPPPIDFSEIQQPSWMNNEETVNPPFPKLNFINPF